MVVFVVKDLNKGVVGVHLGFTAVHTGEEIPRKGSITAQVSELSLGVGTNGSSSVVDANFEFVFAILAFGLVVTCGSGGPACLDTILVVSLVRGHARNSSA